MPAYSCMDSYPHQSSQMPFTQYYYPGFEAFPPYMKVDPTKFSIAGESWPYGGNCGYQMPWHSFCNHYSFPGYYSFRPPYPHIPLPSPIHCCGGHPTYQETYPVHYAHPPHYSMEPPRYEYDKNMPRNNHYCGCPNHSSNQKEDKSMKIEEQEPDVEKNGSDSFVPIQMKNYPYPIVWIPPECSKPSESEVPETDKVPCSAKPRESLKSNEIEPRVWNECFPLDLNSLGSLIQGGNEKRTQNQQNENKKKQFPFPIIWMPSSDKQEEAAKKDKRETDSSSETAEEPPYSFKFIPVNPPQSNDCTNVHGENEKDSESRGGSEVMEKIITNQKNIPIKQMELHEEDNESRGRGVPVKSVADGAINKPSGAGTKRWSPSSPKTSKLPPVCLRVDPLPRRKNGNGISRSPSPPGIREQSQERSNDTSKVVAPSGLKESILQDSRLQNSSLNNSKEVEPNKKDKKVIEVVEGNTRELKARDLKCRSQTQIPVDLPMDSQEGVSMKHSIKKAVEDGDVCKIQENEWAMKAGDMTNKEAIEAKKSTGSAKSAGDEGKLEKKVMSDEEAALLIQSAYRRFEVRKWEPLKKLKQIAEIRQQVVDVRNCIQILESSSDLQRDNKQRVVIGETIMRLLLKLDTIQGLHPTVRDIRKSLARELVSLLEKLDSLMIKKSEEAIKEVSTSESLEQHPVETHNGVCMQEEQKEEATGLGESLSERNCDNRFELIDPLHTLLLDMTTTMSGSQGKVTSGSLFADKVGHEKSKDENIKLQVESDVEPKETEPQQIIEQKGEVVSGGLNVSQVVVKDVEKEKGTEHSELEQSIELPLGGEDKIKSEIETMGTSFEVDGSIHNISEIQEMEELPQVVIDKEPAVFEFEQDEQIGTENNKVQQDAVESNMSVDVVLPAEDDDLTSTDEGPESDHLEELALGVIEGPAVSKSRTHEQVEIEIGGEGKCDVAVEVTSLDEETGIVSHQLEQQPLEVLEEGWSFAKSPRWVKIGYQKDKELPRDTAPEVVVEPPQGKQVNNELSVVSESIDPQPIISIMETERFSEVHENVCEGVNGIDYTCSPVPADTRVPETEVPIEESKEYDQPLVFRKEKKEAQEAKVESQEVEIAIDKANGSETAKEEVLVGIQSTPPYVEQVEAKGESLPASPSGSLVSVKERDLDMESDKKLIEENEKMREMMEKLIEAGKEQLTVISNLTGRVKDLEKKLARKKKLRRKNCGSSTSSRFKPSNKP